MTVHKAMSYKWEEVLFNVDPGESVGRTNANHFRWLYTGVSRARQKVKLINYKPTSPFDKTEFKDNNSGVKPKDILFHSDNENHSIRLEELKQFVTTKLSEQNLSIVRTESTIAWQERYFIKNGSSQEASIYFSYDKKGNFKIPIFLGGDKDVASHSIELLKAKTAMNSFHDMKDSWRRKEYERLNGALTASATNFELIIQTKWKDKIRLFSNESELEIEVDYDGDGLVSHITAKYYNNGVIWDNFKKAVDTLIIR